MSEERKPRADAKLKNLSEERQDQIWEYARTHTLAQIREWLAEDGLAVSIAALSGFLSWYGSRLQRIKNENAVEAALEDLKKDNPELSEEQLFKTGNFFFGRLAIEQQDAKTWKRTQDLVLKREQLDLDRSRFQRETCAKFIEWAENEQAKQIAAGTGTNSEKIERLGALMFGEDWK